MGYIVTDLMDFYTYVDSYKDAEELILDLAIEDVQLGFSNGLYRIKKINGKNVITDDEDLPYGPLTGVVLDNIIMDSFEDYYMINVDDTINTADNYIIYNQIPFTKRLGIPWMFKTFKTESDAEEFILSMKEEVDYTNCMENAKVYTLNGVFGEPFTVMDIKNFRYDVAPDISRYLEVHPLFGPDKIPQ